MTRIDFYVLEADAGTDSRHLACRIAQRAWQAGQRVHIHADDAAAAQQIDALLWDFEATSFVPHRLLQPDRPTDALTPIHIGWGQESGAHEDLLINLAREVPLFFSRFHRVAEIIPVESGEREHGRSRYRFYRERGYPLETRKISAPGAPAEDTTRE